MKFLQKIGFPVIEWVDAKLIKSLKKQFDIWETDKILIKKIDLFNQMV